MGSRSSLSRDQNEFNNDVDHWEMNYHEAAIFLEVNKVLSCDIFINEIFENFLTRVKLHVV